jgi:hypothetical protein
MIDTIDPTVFPDDGTVSQNSTEPALNGEVANELPIDEVDGAWRTEAGRKGAKRVHQLIEAGRLYEQEHGLKSGRQRLRQLIELGKLHEEEHGTRPAVKKRKGRRLSKTERDEVLATLLRCLIRMVKPSFRADLERLANALNVESAQAA